MPVYKRVECPHCFKYVELRKDKEKLKKVNCMKCGNNYNVTDKNSDYYIDYTFENRRIRIMNGKSKSFAESSLSKIKAQIAEKRFLDVKKEQRIKFEDFAVDYLETHSKVNNKSWVKSDYPNLIILKRFFSGKYLHEINSRSVEEFKSIRIKEVSPATVDRQLACLKCLFNKAIAWGDYSGENPVRSVELFKVNNQRKRFLEKDEIVRLINHCKGHLKPIVIVALNTGMRRGEILGLKWRDVDVNRNILYLRNTKNGEAREIPVNEQVKTVLIAVPKHPRSEYIFYKKDGSQINDIKTTWLTAIKNAGIVDFRFHDLRHTTASHLVMSGADMLTVASLLGHKDLKMTQRYAHLSANHKQKAVEVLGKRLSIIPQTNVLQEIPSQSIDFISA